MGHDFRAVILAASVGSAALFVSATADAATISIDTDEGAGVISEYGLRTDTSVDGQDLDGMLVTLTYGDGTSEVLTWRAIDRFAGRVASAAIDIYSLRGRFEMTAVKTLTSMMMEAAPANAVFDMTGTSTPGDDTAGSLIGYPFEILDGDPGDGEINVTYSNGVTVRGYERGVDTFTTMFADFSGLENGGLLGSFWFRTDLDSIAVAGDLTPVSPVPLPAGMPLLLVGLAGLGIMRRRRG